MQHVTSYYWKLLWYDVGREPNARGQAKEAPRTSLYTPFGARHRQTSFKDLYSWKNRMRIEQRIEMIEAPGQCFACKKLGHLKKNYPTRVIKDSVKETLEAYDTIGHQRPPHHDPIRM